MISQLSLNYLSIADADRGAGAEALRELIGIYAPVGDRALEKQMEGLVSLSSRPIVRRLQEEVLSTGVRGLELKVGFDLFDYPTAMTVILMIAIVVISIEYLSGWARTKIIGVER